MPAEREERRRVLPVARRRVVGEGVVVDILAEYFWGVLGFEAGGGVCLFGVSCSLLMMMMMLSKQG